MPAEGRLWPSDHDDDDEEDDDDHDDGDEEEDNSDDDDDGDGWGNVLSEACRSSSPCQQDCEGVIKKLDLSGILNCTLL